MNSKVLFIIIIVLLCDSISGNPAEWIRSKRKVQMCWHTGNCPSRYSCVAFFCVWVGPNDIPDAGPKLPQGNSLERSLPRPNIESYVGPNTGTYVPPIANIQDRSVTKKSVRSTRVPMV